MCTVMKYYEDIAEQKGRAEGKLLSYFEMVQDGDLNINKAALKTNLTKDEFLKQMELAGFKLPKEQTV